MEGNRNFLEDRKTQYFEKLKKAKNAQYLETLPAKRESADSKVKIRKKKVWRKFAFESKI